MRERNQAVSHDRTVPIGAQQVYEVCMDIQARFRDMHVCTACSGPTQALRYIAGGRQRGFIVSEMYCRTRHRETYVFTGNCLYNHLCKKGSQPATRSQRVAGHYQNINYFRFLQRGSQPWFGQSLAEGGILTCREAVRSFDLVRRSFSCDGLMHPSIDVKLAKGRALALRLGREVRRYLEAVCVM